MKSSANFIEEIRWRGMLHDIVPGADELLNRQRVRGYIGFDPTASSLHIGHLAQIMTLAHFQRCGHTPLIVVGGATAMIGDPSGKSAERNLLSEEEVAQNRKAVEAQLRRFLSFEGPNAAAIINNYDWLKGMRFLDFIREAGKHITINYMMAKDSIQKRLSDGLSFTEFCYQLVQAYDFYHLYVHSDCVLQMGGADQWGNMTTGVELIRRKTGGKAFALTTPLLQKSDGSKFGKTESGSVWLDTERTSPYAFYQYWLNISDEEAERFIKTFTVRPQDEIEKLTATHRAEAHQRTLQKALAKDITTLAHSAEACKKAETASHILFGDATTQDLAELEEATLLEAFEGEPGVEMARTTWQACPSVVELLTSATGDALFSGKGEVRRLIHGGGLTLNAQRVSDVAQKPTQELLHGKYILVKKGKKIHYLIKVI